jgi:hypothetical protein
MKLVKNFIRREHIVLFLIFVLGFGFYLYILTRHSLIYGIDGPYYLTQVRSLLENGRLVYGDPPLAFFIFAGFTLVFGRDVTFGIRVGVALFSALSTFPIYFLIRKVTNFKVAGYAAMLACIFSVPHIRLMNDLLKNAIGAFFLLCFVYYLHCLAVEKENRKNLLFSTVFLLLTGATHILDFGVALLFLMSYLILALFLGVNRKNFVKNAGTLLLITLIFGILVFLTFPSLFADFYKGLAFLQDLFKETGQSSPLLFLFNPMEGVFILPILATGVVLSFYEWRTGKREATLAIAAFTIAGLLLSLPFIPHEWLWRFLLMEFIPIAFIVGYSMSKMETKITLTILILLSLFPLILQGIAGSGPMRPTIQEEDYTELELIGEFVLSNSVIVVEPRIGYWFQYITRYNFATRLSPELWRSFEHVLLLIDKLSSKIPPIPLNSTKIVEGNRFILYELPRVI